MISDLWRSMMDNTEFRLLFADRVYKHCFNDGALTDENAQTRWDAIADHVELASIAEFARWGDPYSDSDPYPPTRIDMYGHVQIFIDTLRDWSHSDWPSAELYPEIDPPSFQHGGIVSPGYELTMSGSGTIYYTLDSTDPRSPGGTVAGTAYSGPVILNKSTPIKARAYNGKWSALHEAVFGVGPVRESLRITEIMYHPTDPSRAEKDAAGDQMLIDEDFEYIELKNIGSSAINLKLVQFTDGIDFTFDDYSLGSGQFAVIVKNPDAFQARYPGVSPAQIAGKYTGSLDNGGEEIVIRDAIGAEIHDFDYRDSWFVETDGGGYSLNKLAPDTSSTNALDSWDDHSGWKPSNILNGSPGADE